MSCYRVLVFKISNYFLLPFFESVVGLGPTSTTLFPSDSSPIKVRCHGAGITGPVFLQQRNQFTVDASQAGNNVLFVAVYGPQGQCDNLTIRHLGKNVYNASYALTESGTYAIIVKWGDESITGSPFEVVAS